jgi:hypothetical protein
MRTRLLLASLLLAAVALGQTTANDTQHATPTPANTTAATQDLDSAQIRERLMEELRSYPPEIGMVLKLEPSLLQNKEYLSTYPSLASFVAAHPQVTRSPQYYFEGIAIRNRDFTPDPPNIRMWENILGGFTAFSVFVICLCALLWLIKTLTEQRRWSRVATAQKEATSKLLDRFGSSEEMVSYLQSPTGKSLLESLTNPIISTPRVLGAPINRIFGAVQAGLVAAVSGAGLHIVSRSVPADMAPPLSAIGVLLLSLGLGFLLSAVASFVLSRWMGLWSPATPAATATGGSD